MGIYVIGRIASDDFVVALAAVPDSSGPLPGIAEEISQRLGGLTHGEADEGVNPSTSIGGTVSGLNTAAQELIDGA